MASKFFMDLTKMFESNIVGQKSGKSKHFINDSIIGVENGVRHKSKEEEKASKRSETAAIK